MRFAISFSAIACWNQWVFFYSSEKRFSSGFKIKRVHLNSISLWAHVNLGLNASSLLWPRFQIKLFRSNSACWLLHLKCKLDTRTNKNKKDKTSLKTTVPTLGISWGTFWKLCQIWVTFKRCVLFILYVDDLVQELFLSSVGVDNNFRAFIFNVKDHMSM